MKISIITPTYNYKRFLDDNLRSVLAQVQTDGAFSVEHILVDGVSTDGTQEVLQKWEQNCRNLPENVRSRYQFLWKSEPDRGQTDAINKGLQQSSGDVVCWLNADEFYLPGALQKIASTFAKHPKTDFVYGEPVYCDADGKEIRTKRDHWFSPFVLLWHGCYIASCCSFWRRRILEDGEYLEPSYKVVMDGEYWVRLMKLGYQFRFIPEKIARFTWHGDNVSVRFDDQRKAELMKIKMLYTPLFGTSPRIRHPIIHCVGFFAHQWRRLLVILRLLLLKKN